MSRSSRTNKKSDDNSQQVKDMLELIQSNAERSPQLMALFFEELAVLMRSKCLDRKVEVGLLEALLSTRGHLVNMHSCFVSAWVGGVSDRMIAHRNTDIKT